MPGADAPDEMLCRYGASKLRFRGPRREMEEPFFAFVGGSETFGKFVSRPFTALLEESSGRRCVNFGCVNAGLDTFLQAPDILRLAGQAELTVVQVLGAQNLSNRFYRVHPRRNDRFLAASPMLTALYHEVDFTEIHFNKHLLRTLHGVSPARFATVRAELRQVWLGRMRRLAQALGRRPLLLWLRYRDAAEQPDGFGGKPLLVDRAMLKALKPDLRGIVEIPVRVAGQTGEMGEMRFGPMQAPAAAHMIGPQAHREIAQCLAEYAQSSL